eukprot:PDM61281.1 hypothetical protein PRIPAC_50723 [Pristionchus pacificus]
MDMVLNDEESHDLVQPIDVLFLTRSASETPNECISAACTPMRHATFLMFSRKSLNSEYA